MSPAEEFDQLRLKFTDPIQYDYEVIRPLVLLSETIAERSRQTGEAPSTVGEKARRFVLEGMLGLVDQRAENTGSLGHTYPEAVARHILYLKQIYPPVSQPILHATPFASSQLVLFELDHEQWLKVRERSLIEAALIPRSLAPGRFPISLELELPPAVHRPIGEAVVKNMYHETTPLAYSL